MIPFAALINFLASFLFCIFWLGNFVILYHFNRFGIGILPKRLSAMMLVGSALIFGATLLFYFNIDFTTLLS